MFNSEQMAIRADSADKSSTRRATPSQTHDGEHLDESPGVLYTYPLSRAGRHARAWRDLVDGAGAWPVWGLLPLIATGRSFRRTIVGPYQVLLKRGFNIMVIGLFVGEVLDLKDGRYLPHLVVGVVVWTLIVSLLRSGCNTFARSRTVIHAAPLPLSVHVYERVWETLIRFLFHVGLIVVILGLFFGVRPGWEALVAVPGVVFVCLNGLWAGLLLGSVYPSFRPLQSIMRRAMRLAMLATPIIWMPHQFPNRLDLLQINPLFHFLELVRGPLLGKLPSLTSWLYVGGITVAGWLVAFLVFSRYRGRIAYLV